ncbi:MAG TPA: hypothetical protein VM618_13025, partial [Acidimicrobiia bacterium]|nr:hypothetical protein [Acidimicrobiia bacterium]
VRFGDFRTVTRSTTLATATDAGSDVVQAALDLLARLDTAGGVRLLGVGVSNLEEPGPRQEALPLGDDAPRPGVDDVVEEVRRRFGDDALGRASFLDDGRLRTDRRSAHDYGPDEIERASDARGERGG